MTYYRTATCLSDGTIVEIDDLIAETLEQAQSRLVLWNRIGPNLWHAVDDDNAGVRHACIVEYA